MSVQIENQDGHDVITLKTTSENSVLAKVTTYGATLTHLLVYSLKTKSYHDVVLGFDRVQDYKTDKNRYFGCTIGRVANRIAKGHFELNGQSYSLAVNNGPNALHGGREGFDKKVWKLLSSGGNAKDEAYVVLGYTSADGEEGYPAAVEIQVTYRMNGNSLSIQYHAELKPSTPALSTLLNLSNHSYFNLSGGLEPSILQHRLQLQAQHYLPVDETLIPTGEIRSTEGTPMSFHEPRPIGKWFGEPALETGYDHCYVLRQPEPAERLAEKPVLAATCSSDMTGIQMKFWTTEPGFQLYTAYYLEGLAQGKSLQAPGFIYSKFAAFCLEAQRFPDAIHKEAWRDLVILNPDQIYKQETVYEFSTI